MLEEVKNRDEVIAATLRKLENLNAEIDSLRDKTRKLEKDVTKGLDDYKAVSENLDMMVGQNKEQAKRIKAE